MDIVAFLLFVISTTATPGPNNVMVMTSGLNFGIKRTLPHYFGICLGFPLMVLVLGVGFAAIFIEFPLIHEVIKYLGAAYLLYLAWKIARSHTNIDSDKAAKPFTFMQAFIFQWMNPKAWTMGISALSAYTTSGGHLMLQVFIISGAFFLACLPCIGSWLMFGAGLKKILKSAKHQAYFNYTMGLLLLISVVLIFIE